MIEKEAAYIAGFLDGKGFIGVTRRPRPAGGSYFRPVVSVNHTNRDVLEWLAVVTNGTVFNQAPATDTHKAKFTIYWGMKAQEELLNNVFPFLRIKTQQAYLVLKLIGIKKMSHSRHRAEPETQEWIRNKLVFLNKRGPCESTRDAARTLSRNDGMGG